MSATKALLRRLAIGLGAFDAARALTAATPRIVMYHQFGDSDGPMKRTSVELLRSQLAYIKRHFQPVRLSELAARLHHGDPLPDCAVALTVDDGHMGFVRHALPLLHEYEIPATFFVASQLAEGERWFWEDQRMFLMARDRDGCGQTKLPLAELRRLGDDDRRAYLEAWAQQLGVAIPSSPPPEYAIANWDELRELASDHLIDIGSHSRSHRLLSTLDADDAWHEIDGSRRDLEGQLNCEIQSFCYPSGGAEDYRREHVEMVERSGYQCATTARTDCVHTTTDRFALPRLGRVFDDLEYFRQDLDGVESLRQAWSLRPRTT